MPALTVHVVVEAASKWRARQLMGVTYLLAAREGDHQLYRHFMEMSDRATDPFLRV